MKTSKKLITPTVLLVALATGIMLVGCSSAEKDNTPKSADAAAVIDTSAKAMAQVGAQRFVSIRFAKGKTGLSEASKTALRKLAAETPEKAVDEVKVLAWADREYPASGTAASSKEVELADKRAHNISKYLKDDLGYKVDVDNHNMAKRPAGISEILGTDDYEIKHSLETSGVVPATRSAGETKVIADKASTALIMVKFEN